MSELSVQDFWDFTVKRYSAGGNMQACLELQNEYGVNVNLLLLLSWCVANQLTLTLVDWRAIHNAIKQSEQALTIHRSKRRSEKNKVPFNSGRYQQLKEQELMLERTQQIDILAQFNQQTHLSIEPDQVNGSIPAFINLYNLRGKTDALNLIATVIN
ncbi:TIGR02444 family protein [Alteromonas ponticola]|uniref:TIGR02444 family protein n=1 Tax=Alteromonas ponticola TaxID=2720613 RepID=A0ABX1R2S5_9ALTE|nr:TIGR02444 family protein [Alteromonas ponticola]NMH60768.1 TIGR02444 family protein [Alteromonas ponticola]